MMMNCVLGYFSVLIYITITLSLIDLIIPVAYNFLLITLLGRIGALAFLFVIVIVVILILAHKMWDNERPDLATWN